VKLPLTCKPRLLSSLPALHKIPISPLGNLPPIFHNALLNPSLDVVANTAWHSLFPQHLPRLTSMHSYGVSHESFQNPSRTIARTLYLGLPCKNACQLQRYSRTTTLNCFFLQEYPRDSFSPINERCVPVLAFRSKESARFRSLPVWDVKRRIPGEGRT
jgi:hypothetical protein